MRPHKKKKRSERVTRAILFLASLGATVGFGVITPNETTSWVVVPAFCFALQLMFIVATISIPSPPDPRELTHKSIFRGWLLPDEDDEERERQRQKDELGFNSPDRLHPTSRR